jgi:hypothetical protein
MVNLNRHETIIKQAEMVRIEEKEKVRIQIGIDLKIPLVVVTIVTNQRKQEHVLSVIK